MFSVVSRGAIRTHTFASRSARYLSSQSPPKATSPEQPPPPPPAASTTTSSLPSLDFDPAERLEQAEGTGRTGAKSSKDSLSSIERRRRYLGRVSLGILAIALGVQVLYLGRDWEADELANKKLVRFLISSIPVVIPDVFLAGFDRGSKMHRLVGGPEQRHDSRTCSTYVALDDILRGICIHVHSQYFNKPAWTELLPPPLPSPHQKPYTLLVSMDDLLVTSTWDVSF